MHPSLPWLPWLLQDDGQQLSRVCGLLAAAEGGTALEKDLKVRPWVQERCGWVREAVWFGGGAWVQRASLRQLTFPPPQPQPEPPPQHASLGTAGFRV